MGCCGQGRAALREAAAAVRLPSERAPRADVAGLGPQTSGYPPSQLGAAGPPPLTGVRYSGPRRVRVRGSVSGKAYYFANTGATQGVATADVPALLRTGLFVRT
jgi:hypothetical protein